MTPMAPMKTTARLKLRTYLLMAALVSAPALAQESFRVELGRDGETLGDMRPVFLKFESRPLPAISPAEVARRYQKLFESSDEPEVRIDALNRLNNIRNRSGQEVGFSAEQEAGIYEDVLESYEDILARGSFSGRLDELLYQMAKAHALTGQHQQSIDRLEQLIGLYPKSPLVPEARFRVAEADFSAGRYREAEAGYRQLLDGDGKQDIASKARYMMGWSQFKQGAGAWDRSVESFMALLDQHLPEPERLKSPPAESRDMVEDSFRILAVMAARSDNARSLDRWLAGRNPAPWVPILYDRLADLHAHEGRYQQAVAVNEAFAAAYPDNAAASDMLAQSVEFWQMAGDVGAARVARSDYVARFASDARYTALNGNQKANWRDYSRFLADYHYAGKRWSRSADYYESLALRADNTGEILHLAGDARLQMGRLDQALANFEKAAYTYSHDRSAESAWAAISILRGRLGNRSEPVTGALASLSSAEQRYTNAFGPDARLSALRADLANRWLEAGDGQQALRYARATLDWPQASPREQYAAWLVTARVRQGDGDYPQAEAAWRQALQLVQATPQVAEARDDEQKIQNQLATAIYRQAETAAGAGKTALAVANFQRVETILPGSEIAIKARFDAANTLLKAADWQTAINELRRFRLDFPEDALTAETSEKLVYAYQQSGQPVKAAGELMAAAGSAPEPWPIKLRAAALYHEAGAEPERNDLYQQWLAVAPEPTDAGDHLQQQSMRQRLIESGIDVSNQQNTLLAREDASEWHSEETLQWAADAALALGSDAAERFAAIALTAPLETTLARKQQAMEQAQTYLLQAESFAGEAVQSEVLYRRAELYRTLASDLMASEVPAELNDMETMQYQMLLEEEAFPLEERAMALHARNHQRITGQGYDQWIARSLEALAGMHPGRYQRELRWMSWNMEGNDDA